MVNSATDSTKSSNMRSIIILTALFNAALVQSEIRYTPFFTSPKWWWSNVIWQLPDYLVTANQNPDGTVSAPLGNNLPYTVRK